MTEPTDAELEILQVLWEYQPCTIRTIHEILTKHKEIGYTTTLKQMQRMEEKSMVVRVATSGKSILYNAVVKEQNTKKNLVDKLVEKAFGNSIHDLMLHAIGKDKVSQDEIDRIKELIEVIEKNQKK